jgi:ubiquinone/menaquinone biosynthesis C-methylase UbiE
MGWHILEKVILNENGDRMSKAKDFLKERMREDFKLIGDVDEKILENVAQAWMNDKINSKHRYDFIKKQMPQAEKFLDMASGAGTFVYYGLLNGYDVQGIDPEEWKDEFNKLKAEEYNYPKEWQDKFINGYGEDLPFETNSFDLVSSYQTLEHVQDVKQCIVEMCRVVKNGGGIHIMCPDYRSTYEGHYSIAWIPLFPRNLASLYLKFRNKNPEYLKTLKYTTSKNIREYIIEIAREKNVTLTIIDINKKNFERKLNSKNLNFFKNLYFLYYAMEYTRRLFRSEMNVNYFIEVNK